MFEITAYGILVALLAGIFFPGAFSAQKMIRTGLTTVALNVTPVLVL